MKNSITDVPGIEVGHAQNVEALTGCSVVICRKGAVAGVDQRGGAPGTRETDLLNPVNIIEKVHALLLTGGSAYGLEAAGGVMRYLEEQKIGVNVGVARVPIVPAAVLLDLAIGRADVRPDAEMGYRACLNAAGDDSKQGNVGAGCGATVGKLFGMGQAMKSGIGTASMEIGGGLIVGALMAVNALGDVIDPASGEIIAGTRSAQAGPFSFGEPGGFADTLQQMKTLVGRTILDFASRSNTVIGVVASNARLTKSQATKVAQMAQDGLARSIRPAHTLLDGDTLFAIGTGEKKADVSIVGAWSAEVVARAIVNAVINSASTGGLPGLAG
ncbi:MAG: P1 family peptidase [Anaerolineales bacterium]|nr:P1 family peptidase [Anaerolineales bacterium]